MNTLSDSFALMVVDFIFWLFSRYFAWDYRVLKTFARHYSTGEIIPEKLVESMQGARKMFAATELQRQVYTCPRLLISKPSRYSIFEN